MELSDEQLVEKTQKGDVESFRFLVERYKPKLTRYGSRLLFNKADLEDVVQEIFIKCYRNIKSFDVSRKFSSWVYRIAHNEFINHGKKFSRQLIDYFDFEVLLPKQAAPDNPQEDFDRKQLKEILEKSLAKLDAKYREALVLYYLEGLDYKEIAEILRVSTGTVGIRIMRGKKQLKQYLEPTT